MTTNKSKLAAMLAAIAAVQAAAFDRADDPVTIYPSKLRTRSRSRGAGRPAGSKLARMAAEGRCAKGQPR